MENETDQRPLQGIKPRSLYMQRRSENLTNGIERIKAASLELQLFAEDQISKYGEKETIGDLKFWGLIFTEARDLHYKYYVEPFKIKKSK